MTKFLYFQPQYVREFVCDGAKCPNSCCTRNWNISVDAETYARYANLKPELTNLIARDDATGKFYLRQHPCPLLTDGGLCSLQLEHGEEFLSLTCRTYPRRNFSFGNFFERSLSLTCPLAAEMILFTDEPLSFELVEVSEKVHGGQIILVAEIYVLESLFAHVVEIQIALTKLIAAYESKSFLLEQVPRMLTAVNFNAKEFARQMTQVLDNLRGEEFSSACELLDFTDERKIFTARHSTLMENFLVNELFANCVPWRNKATVAQNFGLFVAAYKVFELLTFAAYKRNFFGKNELLKLVERLTSQTDHTSATHRNLLKLFAGDDMFSLLETFLEGRFKSDGTVDAPRRCN